jgi:class 3 adenylate cyclase
VLGDGIMSLFGAPIGHEEHAVRACFAALGMPATVQQYAAEVQRTKGVPVQLWVELHVGEVVFRSIGNDLHRDHSAVARTALLAAHMEQLATPGSRLLTAATRRREAAAKDRAAFSRPAKEGRRGGDSFAMAAPESVVS